MEQPASSLIGRLTKVALTRHVGVLVLFLTILVLGAVAWFGIPLELIPRGYESQSLHVRVRWYNAPAEEVVDKITLPLEEELSTVKGLERLSSWSSSTSGSRVYMKFKRGTDLAVAYREVRDRVERARLRFPDDVDRVDIRKEDTSGIPVAVIGLAIDPELKEYYDLIDKEIVRPLSRIDGVASVTTDGLQQKEILIEVDRKLAESNGLNIFQLAQDLGGDNFTMASGWVHGGEKEYLLRSIASYESVEELENLLVTPTVRLKQVAKIRYEEPERRYRVRVNSRQAVAAVVLKEGGANTVEVSHRIQAALEKMKLNPRLATIEMEPLFNQGRVVEESISNLLDGGRIGAMFAAVVLFIFLRRFRLTGIITLSIPLSILMALVVLYLSGETLNLLSMLGLVICVGLLVDNSIVVAENIHRLHQAGLSRKDACIQGAQEIGMAITLATLTTVIVFLPAALLEGEVRFFLMRLALPISVALLASLAVALVFIPLSVYLTLPAKLGVPGAAQGWGAHLRLNALLRRFYSLTFERLGTVYCRGLDFFLKHRFDLVLLLVSFFLITHFVAFKEVGFKPSQEEDRTSFNLYVEFSREYGFPAVVNFFDEAERRLEERKSAYGLRGYFIYHRNTWGKIQAWFDKDVPRTEPVKEIAERLIKEFPERPGVRVYHGRANDDRDAKGEDVYTVRLYGDDPLILEEVATRLQPSFLRVPGVIGLRAGNELAPSQLELIVDRERATANQIAPTTIAGVVGYALRGQTLPKYSEGGREIPVRIRFREEDRTGLQVLSSFRVPTPEGETLPLSALTGSRVTKSSRGTYRRNKKVSHSFTLELKKDQAKEARKTLTALRGAMDLPEGVSFDSASRNSSEKEMQAMMLALLLSTFFIYMLMGFLFESFVLPLSIILTIPLSSIGVVWIHYITGRDLDVLGAVGSVLLIGVVVNNGIVLIDYVNRLRKTGCDRATALRTAAGRRFRPIMMTALTTVIGMIPLALSKPNEMGLSYKSFGLTLIGGMTTGTVLTLLVIPVFYTFFDDAREMIAGVFLRMKRSSSSAASS